MSENLKRLNDSDLNSKVKKLKRSSEPLDSLSDSGPLTQEDVVYYQKEAIFRLLNSIKIKNKKLYRELDKINNNYLIVFRYYNILNNWWCQILDNFKNFFNVEDIKDLKDSSLLIDFNICEKNVNSGENDSDKELLKDLNDKRIKMINLLSKLFTNNGTQFNNNETDKDNRLLSLQNSLTNLKVLKTNLESENDLLKQSVNDLNNQLDMAIRNNDKSDSKTLKRVSGKPESDQLKIDLNSKPKTEHSETDNDNSDTNKDNRTNSVKDNESNNTTITDIKDENGNEIKAENRSGNGRVNESGNDIKADNAKSDSRNLNANNSELEDSKLEIIELNGKNNSLNENLNEKLNKIIELENNINELTNKLNNLTEKDLIKLSTNYQLLIKKNEELNANINVLEIDKKKLESQLFELESKLTMNQKNLEEKFKSEIDANSNYILKLESDINRIRSDRDELQSKISILKAEKGKSELTEEYKNLNEILNKRIDELENKDETGAVDADADVDINNNENNIGTLIKHNKILSNELKQLEEAFKSTRIIASNKLSKYSESEFFINKLQIEKNKADEKYFQAMRSKDSLSSQNKILNSNLTKQSELIEILRINEKNLQLKLELEGLMYKKLSEIETFYNNQLTKEKLKSKELEIKFKTNLNNNSDLQSKLTKKQSIIDENERKIISLESNYEGIKSKFSNLESLIQKYRSNSRTEEDEEINQALLSMTKCSLCNKNFKNIALKVCGHCFCSSCVEDRLNARMRKCPNCNQQFSKYDLLSIHL